MRRGLLGIGIACVVGGLVGCGPVDAGSAFQEQIESYLADRDAVVEHDVASFNTLPWSGTAEVEVMLDGGLDDDQIVEEILAIVSHRVDDPVGYSLVVRFPSRTRDGADGVAAAGFEVSGPLEADDVRAATVERIASARALTALGSGPTQMGTRMKPFPMMSRADPFDVADRLCEEPELVGGFKDVVGIAAGSVEEGAVQEETARLEHDFAEDCSTVVRLEEVLDQVRSRTTVRHYTAETLAHTEFEPTLKVSVGTPDDLGDLVASAEASGVRLMVSSGQSTPTSPTPAPTP